MKCEEIDSYLFCRIRSYRMLNQAIDVISRSYIENGESQPGILLRPVIPVCRPRTEVADR